MTLQKGDELYESITHPFLKSLPCVWTCMRHALTKLRLTIADGESEMLVLATTDMPALHQNVSAALTDTKLKFRVVPLDPVDNPVVHLTLHTSKNSGEASKCHDGGKHIITCARSFVLCARVRMCARFEVVIVTRCCLLNTI